MPSALPGGPSRHPDRRAPGRALRARSPTLPGGTRAAEAHRLGVGTPTLLGDVGGTGRSYVDRAAPIWEAGGQFASRVAMGVSGFESGACQVREERRRLPRRRSTRLPVRGRARGCGCPCPQNGRGDPRRAPRRGATTTSWHIPGPCCNNPFVRDPEGALIRPHEGITGAGDLDPALYDWPEPAARITIQRVD